MTDTLDTTNGQVIHTNGQTPTVAFSTATHTTPVPSSTVTNGDEELDFGGARYIGNFHKTLPRHSNDSGEVHPASYVAFAKICDNGLDYEFTAGSTDASKLINPQAGRATETLGPDPTEMHMLPAPSVVSESTAAEMLELYWMAKLRDINFNDFDGLSAVQDAVDEIQAGYQIALDSETHTTGDLRLGLDLPADHDGALDINLQNLFRVGLPGEDKGPLVSQFLLHDFNYGVQLIKATQVPYKTGEDFLTEFGPWLVAQGTGRDSDGNDYPVANNYTANKDYYEETRRRIQTMRDLARFVNRDALHQAYFNAAVQLLNWGAKDDPGNPYTNYQRQVGFGTLGGPNVLALVSEVASRALKVVWRQKWAHRRLRPEAYGGLLHVQEIGDAEGQQREYGLPTELFEGSVLPFATTIADDKKYFLPMAFTSGSPAHPSYGAGHGTVAGACVTVLKAWFDETQSFKDLFAGVTAPKDPSPYFPEDVTLEIWNPGDVVSGTDRLNPYTGADMIQMTIGGELNKLAGNVAMGRSMGGVHWRSDNTRSLRLGEQIATIILSRLMPTYPEQPTLSYTNFDGNHVIIEASGHVSVPADPELEAFYSNF